MHVAGRTELEELLGFHFIGMVLAGESFPHVGMRLDEVLGERSGSSDEGSLKQIG